MKKLLYLTNIEVPYRVTFFNELSKYCDLTVLYERRKSSNRNGVWTASVDVKYKTIYLNGFKIGVENAFSMQIVKHILQRYDAIIVGCYNSPVQIFAMVIMKILRIPYILSTDGEPFINLNSVKGMIKVFFIRGARKYLVAGEKSAESLRKVVGKKEIIPYYFSSLTQKEIEEHAKRGQNTKREKFVLVVGQYFDYKGLDIAVEVARLNPGIHYKFIGMGNRTDLFLKETGADRFSNIEIIPFLQKEKLEEEYLKCEVMLLPSKQECWGLVINEAASYGTPIVSTWGAGAAIEFLSDHYSQYLARTQDAEDLSKKIRKCITTYQQEHYSKYLYDKNALYSVERMVDATLLSL